MLTTALDCLVGSCDADWTQGLDVDTPHVAGLYKIMDGPDKWTSEDCRRPAWRRWDRHLKKACEEKLRRPCQLKLVRILVHEYTTRLVHTYNPTTNFPPASWAKWWEVSFSSSTSSSFFYFKISHMRRDDANKNSMITGDNWDHQIVPNPISKVLSHEWASA